MSVVQGSNLEHLPQSNHLRSQKCPLIPADSPTRCEIHCRVEHYHSGCCDLKLENLFRHTLHVLTVVTFGQNWTITVWSETDIYWELEYLATKVATLPVSFSAPARRLPRILTWLISFSYIHLSVFTASHSKYNWTSRHVGPRPHLNSLRLPSFTLEFNPSLLSPLDIKEPLFFTTWRTPTRFSDQYRVHQDMSL